MSIVVFDPDSTSDVDFRDRMRHPMGEDDLRRSLKISEWFIHAQSVILP